MRISDWSSDVCSSDLPDSPEPDEAQEARTAKRRKLLRILAIVVAAVALLWGIWYFLTQAGRVSTDNAYVGADSATVTALVPGPVAAVRVSGTQAVQKGDVLVVLYDARSVERRGGKEGVSTCRF